MRSVFAISLFAVILSLLAPAPTQAGPDRIVMNQFAGFAKSDGAMITFFVKGPNGWQPIMVHGAGQTRKLIRPAGLSGCLDEEIYDSLLKQIQIPALNKFVETLYKAKPEAEKLARESTALVGRPVTFLLYLTDRPPPNGLSGLATKDLQLIFGVDFSPPPVEGVTTEPLPSSGYVHAGLYVVPAQEVVGTSSKYPMNVPRDVAWMHDPEFEDEAKLKFDREKYPLVWNIGRGSREEAGQFPQLMSMAGQTILREVQHYGVPHLEKYGVPSMDMYKKSYVSFDSGNADFVERMKKKFPKGVFLTGKHHSDHVVFLVSLDEYLKEFPPKEINSAHKIFTDIVGPGHTPAEIQSFIEAVKYAQAPVLDFRYQGKLSSKPLFLNMTFATPIEAIPMGQFAQNYRIPLPAFHRLLDKKFFQQHTGGLLDPIWPGKMVDPATSYAIPQGPDRPKGFQISNLDPYLAGEDPNYIPSVLVASLDHYAGIFYNHPLGPDAPELKGMAKAFKDENLGFIITTNNPKTAAAAIGLGAEYKGFDLSNEPNSAKFWEHNTIHTGDERPSQRIETFKFTLEQIIAFRTKLMKDAADHPGDSKYQYPTATPGVNWWLAGSTGP